jgi:site-specific DNA-methyltransferase (adenine-specific)
LHANQKPLSLIERVILASSDPGDVVWEPFGGLCSAAIASLKTGRQCMSAEINPSYYRLAQERLVNQVLTIDLWDLADKHQE